MRSFTITLVFCILPTITLADNKPLTAGEQWEKALIDTKKAGKLPGPKPGQKCLWSPRLNACLWYTPGKWMP